jgi:hypothetical protein
MNNDAYLAAFRGGFTGMLRWDDLDRLWQTVLREPAGWYVYAVGETPPAAPASPEQLAALLPELTTLLRRDHAEDYCGIVYADQPEAPAFIKVYDPNNLGVSCGFSLNPPLPGWLLSRLPPCDLPAALPPPAARRRWWQRLFAAST